MKNVATRSLLTAGLLAAFGLGIWSAPYVRPAPSPTMAGADRGDVALSATPERTSDRRPAGAARAAAALSADAEPVREHARPLLTWGTDTKKAAEGFASAEQFLTVAHAAKNTDVPFVLLKHRVLTEGVSLAEAIKASAPALDARLEAERARLNARAELARLGE